MGNTDSVSLLQSDTHFSRSALKELNDKFLKKYPNGKLTKDEFINELSLQGGTKEFWESVFELFDRDGSGSIDFKELILGLSMIHQGSNEEKLSFAFKLYDSDGNGVLDMNEVSTLVAKIFEVSDTLTSPEEKHQVQQFFKKMDQNNDGEISLQEFIDACKDDPVILSAIENAIASVVEIRRHQGNIEMFGHQAAGHKGMKKEGAKIFKNFTDREFDIYQSFKTHPEIKEFVPQYFGRTQFDNGKGGVDHYIILEDLTHGKKHPSIIDLKMGRHTHEEDAPFKKKMTQSTLDTLSTTKNLGFRICGMRVYQANLGTYVVHDKPWGIALKDNEIQHALKMFVENGWFIRYEVISAFLPKLRKLQKWFEVQTEYKFVGTSILLIYEGEVPDNSKEPPVVDVRMVDFAHTKILDKDKRAKDEDFLFGLRNLIKIFESIEEEGKMHKQGIPHKWEEVAFPKPTFCKLCNRFIWGITKQGYQCTECKCSAHRNCYKLIPHNCQTIWKK